MKLLTKFAFMAALLGTPAITWANEEEIEELARGPVHEAYAEPSERQPTATPVIAKEPPKVIEELPPDQKPEGDNVQWIPGYWAWDEDRKDFIWISGFWRNYPPGRTWMPGSWRQTDDGWQWTGGIWVPVEEKKAELEYLPEPPKPLDVDGANIPAPEANQVYVPGCWVYRTRYVWRPGYWCAHNPSWVWQSAHYRWTPCGYVFIDGYYDYPLADRGILFAPCYIPPVVCARPAYVYTPTVIVREPCLYGAFFARRGFGCYYFGDYFAPRYASIGFTSWSGHVSATVTLGGFHDPLYSHYSAVHARDPFWGGGGLANLYVGRYRGDFARPPVNFRQQNVVINNIKTTNITNVKNVTNINNVQMLSTLKDASSNTPQVRLANATDAFRKEQQSRSREIQTIAGKRAEQETTLARLPRGATPKIGMNPVIGGTTEPVKRNVKLDVPTNLQPKVNTAVLNTPKPGVVLPKSDLRTRDSSNTPPAVIGNPSKVTTLPPPKMIDPKTTGTGTGTGTSTTVPPKNTNPPVNIPPKNTNPPVIVNPPKNTMPPVTIPPKNTNPPVNIPPKNTMPPVTIPPKNTNPPVIVNPPKTSTPPVIVNPPKTSTPPVIVNPPKTSTPPVIVNPPKTSTPPVIVNPPKTSTPPVIVNPPKTSTPPVIVNPPKTSTPPAGSSTRSAPAVTTTTTTTAPKTTTPPRSAPQPPKVTKPGSKN